jgi:AP-3 complex subunit beta
MAKSFPNESDLVKLQTMTLAAKLYVASHPSANVTIERVPFDRERLKLLVNFVFQLAKYDVNYDVRDRGRFLKQLLNEMDNRESGLQLASRILLTSKRVANGLEAGTGMERHHQSCYRVGTLSHYLGKQVSGYTELPDYPEVQPDPTVRDRAEEEQPQKAAPTFERIKISKGSFSGSKKLDKFYSSSEDEEEEEEGSTEESDEEESDEEEDEESSVADENEADESDEDEEESDEEESSEEEQKK